MSKLILFLSFILFFLCIPITITADHGGIHEFPKEQLPIDPNASAFCKDTGIKSIDYQSSSGTYIIQTQPYPKLVTNPEFDLKLKGIYVGATPKQPSSAIPGFSQFFTCQKALSFGPTASTCIVQGLDTLKPVFQQPSAVKQTLTDPSVYDLNIFYSIEGPLEGSTTTNTCSQPPNVSWPTSGPEIILNSKDTIPITQKDVEDEKRALEKRLQGLAQANTQAQAKAQAQNQAKTNPPLNCPDLDKNGNFTDDHDQSKAYSAFGSCKPDDCVKEVKQVPLAGRSGTLLGQFTCWPAKKPSLVGSSSAITCNPISGEADAKPNPANHGILTAIGCIPTEPVAFVKGTLKFITLIAGAIALILMVLGALRMIWSSGNADELTAGQEQFKSALIGLLFILFSVLLLEIIGVDILGIPGLGRT